jgi:site-specific DNA recombinase
MNVRLTFDRERFYLDLGDLYTLTEQLNASGAVTEWQKVFDYMQDNGIQGVTIGANGAVVITPKGLTDEEEAAAAEFYGWEVEA